MKIKKWIAAFVAVSFFCYGFMLQDKPVLYIIGDSTVKNGSGKGIDSLWGWGSFIADYFDTTKMDVQNHAIGGRSSRTFITEGRWEKIMGTLKKGDYVIMQFGHNDAGPLDDTARARGTIRGIGDDSTKIYNPIRKMNETVHTYGWYMRKIITEAQSKGAVAIVCSPVPRNNFKDGKVERGNNDYGLWAKQVAAQTGALFIDLNNMIADKYDSFGADKTAVYFPKDHTHTDEAGAILNASLVIEGIKQLKSCSLNNYLLK
ncbi:rhamnogalacturonan acetylesterase [Parafilimonas sp.]|uniref:rhamnogalacturonan acetylesterase n=1 Tax=Parafilimonas sp. TaxID=1969739 RepID=UPI0039E673EC